MHNTHWMIIQFAHFLNDRFEVLFRGFIHANGEHLLGDGTRHCKVVGYDLCLYALSPIGLTLQSRASEPSQYEKSGYEPAYGGRSSDFHHQSSRWPLAKSPRLIIVASMVVKL
jgi:hypothetical protein